MSTHFLFHMFALQSFLPVQVAKIDQERLSLARIRAGQSQRSLSFWPKILSTNICRRQTTVVPFHFSCLLLPVAVCEILRTSQSASC